MWTRVIERSIQIIQSCRPGGHVSGRQCSTCPIKTLSTAALYTQDPRFVAGTKSRKCIQTFKLQFCYSEYLIGPDINLLQIYTYCVKTNNITTQTVWNHFPCIPLSLHHKLKSFWKWITSVLCHVAISCTMVHICVNLSSIAAVYETKVILDRN
jgi:hypothetical protein